MGVIRHECPNCGSMLELSPDRKFATCPACDSKFQMDDDNKPQVIHHKVTIEGITTPEQMLKRAEQCMREGNYDEASKHYRTVISKHDASCSEAWWGLVRISQNDFKDISKPISVRDLGKDYENAFNYGTPAQRTQYEEVIRKQQEAHKDMVTKRDAEAEAILRKKREDDARAEAERLRKEKERQEKERQDAIRRKQQARVRNMILAIVLVVALIAAAVVWFVVLPKQRYNEAAALMENGQYAEAIEAFNALNGYGDSEQSIGLCEAMLSLKEGNLPDVRRQLLEIEESGNSAYAQKLKTEVCSKISNWKNNGLTADSVLYFLQAQAEFDPSGSVDAEKLFNEAHVALAGDQLISHYISDINGDGENDLIVLEPEQNVRVYRMLADGNLEVALEEGMHADCLVRFGDELIATDAEAAIACYNKALESKDAAATRERIAGVYTGRAQSDAAVKDYGSAIVSAQAAFDVNPNEATFAYYYEMSYARATDATTKEETVALWDAFADENEDALTAYGRFDAAKEAAGQFRLAYADELASWKDTACLEWYYEAEECGVPVQSALENALTLFDVGLDKLELRLAIADRAEAGSAEQAAQLDAIAVEAATVLSDWSNHMDGLQAMNVMDKLEARGVAVDPAVKEACYESIMRQQIGAEEAVFGQWIEGGDKEMLALKDEKLVLYAEGENGFDAVSELTVDSQPGAKLTAFVDTLDGVVESSEGFMAFSIADGQLEQRFALVNSDITYNRSDRTIDCSIPVPGSIERTAIYTYSLDDGLTRYGIELPLTYPEPQTAEEAAIRFVEASGFVGEEFYYLLAEEAELGEEYLPYAVDFTEITANASYTSTDYEIELDEGEHAAGTWWAKAGYVMVEVQYEAFPTGEPVVAQVIVGQENGQWRVFNAFESDSYGDTSIAPLNMNGSNTSQFTASGETAVYRMIVPRRSEVTLNWQAGDAAGGTAYQIAFFRDAACTDAIIAYDLGLTADPVSAPPLFMNAGVYYVRLTAKKGAENIPYTLSMSCAPNEYVEVEPNNTINTAGAISTNHAYSGALTEETDVDLYCFTLEAPAQVVVELTYPAMSETKGAFNLAVATADGATVLYGATAPANAGSHATGNLYLGAGKYIVQIQKSNVWNSGNYKLNIWENYSESAEGERLDFVVTDPETGVTAYPEIEVNNAPETATEITGQPVVGSCSTASDADWYKFTVDQNFVFGFHFAFPQMDPGAKAYDIDVQNAAGKSVMQATLSGKQNEVESSAVCLPAGTYYISVQALTCTGDDYQLSLNLSEAGAIESESNDKADKANPLAKGVETTGVLSSQKDADMYSFDVAEGEVPHFWFIYAVDAEPSDAGIFTLEIEQKGKVLWSTTLTEAGGGMDADMQLPAGSYQIRIKAADAWHPGAYTIAIQ